MKKGTTVKVHSGRDEGKTGVVFWVGKAKFGSGLRLGLKTGAGETVWANESAVKEVTEDGPPAGDGAETEAKPGGFRFYGDQPLDWIEGASDGHGFSVQFESPPSAEQLLAIADLYESMLSKGPASPARSPWEWSERFGHFHVGERGMAGSAILGPVLRLLWKVHAIAPIRDVVYANAREGAGGPAQPPDPGPPGWHYLGQFGRELDPTLPPLAPHEPFEQARLAAALRSWDRDTREQIDKEIKALRGEERIRLDHFAGQGPAPAPPSTEASALFEATGERSLEQLWRPPVAVAVVQADGELRVIAQGQASTRRELVLPEATWEPRRVAVHPGGERILVGGQDIIVEIDLTAGSLTPRRYPALGERLQDLAYLAGKRWAALTADRLYVLEPGPEGDALVDMVDAKRSELHVLLDGKLVVAFSSIGQPWFYTLAGRQLKKLGSTKARIDSVVEHDGRLLCSFEPATDSPRSWYELLGIREALAKLETRKPRRKKAAKPVIETITHDVLPDDLRATPLAQSGVEQEREWNTLFSSRFEGWGSEYTNVPAARSARGVLATVVEPTTILLSEAEGQVRKLRKFRKGQDVTQLSFDPSGRYLFACCRGLVTRIDLDEGFARETVHEDPSKPMQICAVSGEKLLGYFLTGVCQLVRKDGAWTLVGAKKVPRYTTATLSSSLEAILLLDSTKGVRVYAAVGEKMVDLWKWSVRCTKASVVGTRVFIHLDWVERFPAAEVLGLVAALEAKRSGPARKRAAKPRKKPGTKKVEIAHTSIDPDSVPDDAPEQAIFAQLGISGDTEGLHGRQSASGLRAALCDPAGGGYYKTLVVETEQGPRSVDLSAITSVTGFDVAPDGSVYLSRLQGFLKLDLDTGEPSMLLELNMDKRPTSYGKDLVALDDDTLLALGSRQVLLLRRDEAGQWRQVAKRNVKEAKRLFPLRTLGLVVILTGNPRERVLVLGIKKNDRLQILTTLGGWLDALRVGEGRVFVRTVNKEAWELSNLAEVAEALG